MSRPTLITSPTAMTERARRAKQRGTVGLVPTMGALHEGHLSLVRAAKKSCSTVVVSIFVNPTQFGPTEDFDRYPRTLQSDLELLDREQVDVVFAPSKEEMYPQAIASTYVEVERISERLDGAHRPGHFRGVATVVAKLFNITLADVAFFGQKDAAQVAVLRAMVRDLNFPVELVVGRTVREADHVAMSSRNRYLTAAQRERSRVIYRALSEAQAQTDRGVRDAAGLTRIMSHVLEQDSEVDIEYVEVVDPGTLERVPDVSGGALAAIAVRIGGTRLIDNILLHCPKESACE